MKNIKGITLITLVIVIIVLLILAGVAITGLTQAGLLENAKQAKNAIKNAEIEEDTIIGSYENNVNEIVEGSRETITITEEELNAKIANAIQEALKENEIKSTLSDLDWILLGSTMSSTFVKLDANIDDYNYIAIVVSNNKGMLDNPVKMSVKSFKKLCTSSEKILVSQWTASEFAAAYYDNGVYMKYYGNNQDADYCSVFGIK